VIDDPDRCYEAARSRDPRFDGWFFVAVTSTGIYCRPSCPARTPKRENARFYPTAAAAQRAGFRACRRCRPDATPGSPEWNVRADVVARAMRLVRDGVVDREGVAGLARRLGYSVRQLDRFVTAELGTGPLAIARAQRCQTARILLECTELPVAEVAFASGFSSVRQCNDTIRQTFADTPSGLRGRAPAPSGRRGPAAAATGDGPACAHAQRIRLRLAARRPFAPAHLLAYLGTRAVPGVEEHTGTAYRRSLRLPHGAGVVTLSATGHGGHLSASVDVDLHLTDLRDLTSAVSRCRQLLDLDADPVAVEDTLLRDPLIAPLVATTPGLRVPGAVDGFELAVRAVIGQHVSVAGARSVVRRLVSAAGEPLSGVGLGIGAGLITHLFPTAAAVVAAAGVDGAFAMPTRRRDAVVALARAVEAGDVVLDQGADPGELRRSLLALPGIGPWTAEYVAMRALRDPDAYLPSDLAVRRALTALGGRSDIVGAVAAGNAWRPWRSYATAYLWTAPGASVPAKPPTSPAGAAVRGAAA